MWGVPILPVCCQSNWYEGILLHNQACRFVESCLLFMLDWTVTVSDLWWALSQHSHLHGDIKCFALLLTWDPRSSEMCHYARHNFTLHSNIHFNLVTLYCMFLRYLWYFRTCFEFPRCWCSSLSTSACRILSNCTMVRNVWLTCGQLPSCSEAKSKADKSIQIYTIDSYPCLQCDAVSHVMLGIVCRGLF